MESKQPLNAFVVAHYECYKIADKLYLLVFADNIDGEVSVVVPEDLVTAISAKPYARHDIKVFESYK